MPSSVRAAFSPTVMLGKVRRGENEEAAVKGTSLGKGSRHPNREE